MRRSAAEQICCGSGAVKQFRKSAALSQRVPAELLPAAAVASRCSRHHLDGVWLTCSGVQVRVRGVEASWRIQLRTIETTRDIVMS